MYVEGNPVRFGDDGGRNAHVHMFNQIIGRLTTAAINTTAALVNAAVSLNKTASNAFKGSVGAFNDWSGRVMKDLTYYGRKLFRAIDGGARFIMKLGNYRRNQGNDLDHALGWGNGYGFFNGLSKGNPLVALFEWEFRLMRDWFTMGPAYALRHNGFGWLYDFYQGIFEFGKAFFNGMNFSKFNQFFNRTDVGQAYNRNRACVNTVALIAASFFLGPEIVALASEAGTAPAVTIPSGIIVAYQVLSKAKEVYDVAKDCTRTDTSGPGRTSTTDVGGR